MPLAGASTQRTLEATARAGGERAFRADAVGLEARGDYTVITGGVALDGAALGVQRQLVGTGLATWRHDWGRQFTSRLEAGAVRVQRLESGHGFFEPTGTAALDWTHPLGNAELSVAHRVTTNPLLGQTLLVDEVQLRAGVPFDDEGKLALGASAGYQRGRLIEEDATLAAHLDTLLFDVGLAWQTTEASGVGRALPACRADIGRGVASVAAQLHPQHRAVRRCRSGFRPSARCLVRTVRRVAWTRPTRSGTA